MREYIITVSRFEDDRYRFFFRVEQTAYFSDIMEVVQALQEKFPGPFYSVQTLQGPERYFTEVITD